MGAYNLFVISKLEVVLNDPVFVFLDFVTIQLTLLDFTEVPGNHELACRSHDGIFLLAFALVKP